MRIATRQPSRRSESSRSARLSAAPHSARDASEGAVTSHDLPPLARLGSAPRRSAGRAALPLIEAPHAPATAFYRSRPRALSQWPSIISDERMEPRRSRTLTSRQVSALDTSRRRLLAQRFCLREALPVEASCASTLSFALAAEKTSDVPSGSPRLSTQHAALRPVKQGRFIRRRRPDSGVPASPHGVISARLLSFRFMLRRLQGCSRCEPAPKGASPRALCLAERLLTARSRHRTRGGNRHACSGQVRSELRRAIVVWPPPLKGGRPRDGRVGLFCALLLSCSACCRYIQALVCLSARLGDGVRHAMPPYRTTSSMEDHRFERHHPRRPANGAGSMPQGAAPVSVRR
jgi:hypothetical protein